MLLCICKSVVYKLLRASLSCICRCFSLALFMHDGFDPPYGSNPLPIVNFLYIYTETSTLKEIL